jgi:hypothetical protein
VYIPDAPRSTSPEPMEKNMLDEEKTLHEIPSLDPQPLSTSRRKRRRHVLPFHRSDVRNGPSRLLRLIRHEKTVSLVLRISGLRADLYSFQKMSSFTRRSERKVELDALKQVCFYLVSYGDNGP